MHPYHNTDQHIPHHQGPYMQHRYGGFTKSPSTLSHIQDLDIHWYILPWRIQDPTYIVFDAYETIYNQSSLLVLSFIL